MGTAHFGPIGASVPKAWLEKEDSVAEVALREDVTPAFRLDLLETSPTGLAFKGDPTLEDWARVGEYLGHLERWSPWAIGDWYLEGEKRFGQEFSQFLAEGREASIVGVSGATVRNYARTCRKIPAGKRRVELEFSHHRLVGEKVESPAEQDEWLERAVTGAWSLADLRAALKAGGEVFRPELEVALGKVERACEWASQHLSTADLREFRKALTKMAWER